MAVVFVVGAWAERGTGASDATATRVRTPIDARNRRLK